MNITIILQNTNIIYNENSPLGATTRIIDSCVQEMHGISLYLRAKARGFTPLASAGESHKNRRFLGHRNSRGISCVSGLKIVGLKSGVQEDSRESSVPEIFDFLVLNPDNFQ